MAASLSYFILIFVVVQLATAQKNLSLNYADCIKDVANTKQMFDEAIASYWTQIMPPQLGFSRKYNAELKEMKLDACRDKTMAGKTSKEYVYLGSQPCKVFPLKENYVAPWTTEETVSDRDVCLYISTKGKVALTLANNNLLEIRSCDGVKWFNDTYVKSYVECRER